MQLDVVEALGVAETPAKLRKATTSVFSTTPEKLARKKTTKTDVLIITPKGDDLRALKIPSTKSRYHNAFDIQRLIPGLNKSGTLYERPDHHNPKLRKLNPKTFTEDKDTSAWRLGTFVLVLKGANKEIRKVRNIYNDEETWNARSLQHVHRPWGLPGTLPYDEGGVPFKIVFPKYDMSVWEGYGRAFEAGEPLLVLTAPEEDADVMLPVIDFEGYRGEINKLDVVYGHVRVPWNIRVNERWWRQQIELFNEEARRWAKMDLIAIIIVAHESPPLANSPSSKVFTKRRFAKSGAAPLLPKSEEPLNQQSLLLWQTTETTPKNHSKSES